MATTPRPYPSYHLEMREWYLDLLSDHRKELRNELWRFLLQNNKDDPNKSNFYFKTNPTDVITIAAILNDVAAFTGLPKWRVWGQVVKKLDECANQIETEHQKKAFEIFISNLTSRVGVVFPSLQKTQNQAQDQALEQV